MGHFVGVFTDDLPKLESIIGSDSAEHFASVLQTCGGKFDLDPKTHQHIAAALQNIIANSYPSAADDLENYYGNAFHFLCTTFAHKWTVQEIYVSDESFPEIFGLVWGSDLPGHEDPFGDPSVDIPYGDGGVVFHHRSYDFVKVVIEELSNLDYDRIAELNGTDYREEIAEILKVLTAAEQAGQGIYITWAE
jgi:hypothetical protein